MQALLEAGGDPNRANARGRTSLHVAASSSHGEDAVRALVSGGADANRKDRSGNTPRHTAVGPNLGQPGVVRTLLNGGGDPSARNGDGLTVLQLFVRVPDAPRVADVARLRNAASDRDAAGLPLVEVGSREPAGLVGRHRMDVVRYAHGPRWRRMAT